MMQAAQARGLSVVTFDNRAQNPGHLMAEHSAELDVCNTKDAIAFVSGYDIVAATAPCSDVSLQTLAVMCERFKLRGPSIQLVDAMIHKSQFRALQARLGLPAPRSMSVDCDESFHSLQARIIDMDRILIKPDLSSGSKGISLIRAIEFAAEHLEAARAVSLTGRVVIEEEVEGRHGTFEGFLFDGEPGAALITERLRNSDGVGTVGHVVPSGFTPEEERAICKSIVSLFGHFGYENGPVDADFVIHDNVPVLIEATPRLGGNSLSKLFRAATGHRQEDVYLDWLLDSEKAQTLTVPLRSSATLILHGQHSGILHYDRRALAEFKPQWLLEAALDHLPDTPVQTFRKGSDRFGELTITCIDRSDALDKLAQFEEAISLSVHQGNNRDAR